MRGELIVLPQEEFDKKSPGPAYSSELRLAPLLREHFIVTWASAHADGLGQAAAYDSSPPSTGRGPFYEKPLMNVALFLPLPLHQHAAFRAMPPAGATS